MSTCSRNFSLTESYEWKYFTSESYTLGIGKAIASNT